MRLFGGITLFFYTLIILMVGGFFIIVATNIIPLTYMIEMLGTILAAYGAENRTDAWIVIALIGGTIFGLGIYIFINSQIFLAS